MNSRDLQNLCEAYGEIYEDNDFELWVDSLIEEGYDLSDYTWEEMYEEYLNEMGQVRTTGQRSGVWRPTTTPGAGSAGGSGSGGRRGSRGSGGVSRPTTTPGAGSAGGSGRYSPGSTQTRLTPTTGGSTITTTPRPSGGATIPTPTPRPATPRPTPAAAPAPTGGAKVSPSVTPPSGGQTGDKAKDMATWAKANPTLANKPRTPNPLMQRTFGYQTGQGPRDQKGITSQTGSTTKSQSSIKKESVMWGDASKIVNDIADIYQSVYEAKKVDQDQDGDNDFADIRIARMIASGVPKEVAIAKVKGKSYNEEIEIYEETEEERKRNERRARIAELQASGRVMTSSKRASLRAKQRKEEQRAEKLERLANAAIESTRGTSRRSSAPMGSQEPEEKENAPEANRRISSSVKNDRLASRADKLLRMLQKEDFELWIDELLDEGYDLSDYTWDEMAEIYVNEAMIEGPRKKRMKEKQHSALKSRDRGTAFNIGTRNDTGSNYTKKSTGGKGSRFPGYGDRGAGNKARRRMGQEPLRGDTRFNEDFILWIDELLDEGYELDNWTDEELYDLYEEIIEEKYGTAAGRKRVAKKARAGKDIGKKGPGFEKMVNKLSSKYGKERATKIAAAQMWKTHA